MLSKSKRGQPRDTALIIPKSTSNKRYSGFKPKSVARKLGLRKVQLDLLAGCPPCESNSDTPLKLNGLATRVGLSTFHLQPSSPWRNQVLPNDGACNEGSGDSAAG